jgi:hypothetical protein
MESAAHRVLRSNLAPGSVVSGYMCIFHKIPLGFSASLAVEKTAGNAEERGEQSIEQ